jgi:putative membrane protein
MAEEGDVNFHCGFGDAGCVASEKFFDAAYKNISSTLGEIGKALGTFWVDTPSINLGTAAGQPSDVVGFLWSSTGWFTGVFLVFAVLYGAGQMIWQRRGQPLWELVVALLKFTFASGAGLAACVLLLQTGDGYSKWVIEKSTPHGGFGDSLMLLLSIGVANPSSGIIMFVIVIGIIAILVSFVQIGMLIVRGALALVLAGTLPLAYSATNTSWGRQWSQKHTAWLIAFIVYKPVASTIYAAAFRILDSFGKKDGDVGQQIVYFTAGIVLMIAGLVALPAIMRLVTPAVGAAAGAGAMFAGAAGGAVASGAINGGMNIGGKSSGGGDSSSSSGGDSGATGAANAKSASASAGESSAATTAAGGGGGASSAAAGGASAGGGSAAAGAAGGPVGLAVVAGAQAAAGAAQKVGQATSAAVHQAAGESAPDSVSSSVTGGGSSGGGASSGPEPENHSSPSSSGGQDTPSAGQNGQSDSGSSTGAVSEGQNRGGPPPSGTGNSGAGDGGPSGGQQQQPPPAAAGGSSGTQGSGAQPSGSGGHTTNHTTQGSGPEPEPQTQKLQMGEGPSGSK